VLVLQRKTIGTDAAACSAFSYNMPCSRNDSFGLLLADATVDCLQDNARDAVSERSSLADAVVEAEVMTSSEADADVPVNCASLPVSPAADVCACCMKILLNIVIRAITIRQCGLRRYVLGLSIRHVCSFVCSSEEIF